MLKSLLNQRLGRYYIKELLGRGGMAAVYRATDTALQRDVALKILYPHFGDDAGLVERFKREAVLAAALEHSAIVPVYDVDAQDDMVYMAMKLLSGQTLQELLQQQGTLDPDTLLTLLGPIAAALDYAHGRGVIHRDIKPGNIFLSQTPDGVQPILADFGIAKRLDTPGLTTTGAVLGTPDYMAPEQISGAPIDRRADVYALGALVFRTLTGRRPYEGSTQDVLLGHLYQQPPSPSALQPALTPAIDAVVLCAMARDPAARYESAGAFVRALRQAVRQIAQPTAVGRPPALPRTSAPPATSPQPRPPVAPVPHTARPARLDRPTAPLRDQPAPRRSGTVLPWTAALLLATVAGGLLVALGMTLAGARSQSVGASPPLPDTAVATAPSPSATLDAPTPAVTEPAVAGLPNTPAATLVADVPSATPAPPSATPAPPSPTILADCTDGKLAGGFGQLYREIDNLRVALGCPREPEVAGQASVQFFQNGMMFWWGLQPTDMRDTVIVFYGRDSGRFARYTKEEIVALGEAPPQNDTAAPQRGFGSVYYFGEDVAESLGTWTSPEIELSERTAKLAVIQFYESGTMIYTPEYLPTGKKSIFVLYNNSETFERYDDPFAG